MKLHVLLIAVVLLAIPFHAQAQTQYITDGSFTYEDTYWTRSANATWDYVPGCLWGNPTTTVAEPNNSGTVSQTFYVNTSHVSYSMRFVAFLVNDTDNFYDQLKAKVYNHTTGVTETVQLNGNSYTGSCTYNVVNLANDYDNDWVTVTFEVSALALGTWQVDDVAWFGRPY